MEIWIFLPVVLIGICRSTHSASQYHFIRKPRSYADAQLYCRSMYTDLATINNVADMKSLLATVTDSYTGAAWIGLYQQSTPTWHWSLAEGQYYPQGGTEYRNWKPGEPDNAGGIENCGSMGDDGQFLDVSCSLKRRFICFDAVSNQKYVMIETAKTWKEAQSYCRLNHTDLVSIMNPEENLQIQELIMPNDTVFIGLFRDNFTWSDDSNYAFRYWATGHPTAGNASDCCVGLYVRRGPWVCGRCFFMLPFFCFTEKKKQILKVEVQSDHNPNDPVVKAAILEKFLQVVKDNNMATQTNLTWRQQPDGNVFYKKITPMDPPKCA